MAIVKYLMTEDKVTAYVAAKKEIIAARNSLKPDEIKTAKADILKECAIYDDAEGNGYEPAEAYTVENGKAIIPIKGMLAPEVSPCAAFFGDEVTTYGFIKRAIQKADEDPQVKEIFLDIDSGGGYVEGLEEAGAVIAAAKKPTTAMVGSLTASAAYWLAAQADTIVATQKTGFVGSIGVVTEYIDRSKADAAQGYTRITITNRASKDKRPDYATEEGKAVLLEELDDLYEEFKGAILMKRGASLSSEGIDAMAGKVFIAEKAKSLGLVDKVASRDDLIKNSDSGTLGSVRRSACADTKRIGGNSMTLKEFLDSEPEAQAEYNTSIAAAKAEGKKEADADMAKYRADVLKIVELSGGTLNKVALASIEKGDTPADFALAELEAHKANGKATDAGVVEAKKKLVPEAKSVEDKKLSAIEEHYTKRIAALKGGR